MSKWNGKHILVWNDKHLSVVQQGARAIAKWREGHPETRLELCKANLAGANLRGANLSGADLDEALLGRANLASANLRDGSLRKANLEGALLREASLVGANLIETNLCDVNFRQANLVASELCSANLTGSNLRDADLRKADLTGANFRMADLRAANLRGANLEAASLVGANLSGADLTGANLSDARCQFTIFARVDLSECVGLEKVRHAGPSTLGSDTFRASKGRFSENFLRGCGLAEWEIENAKLYAPDLSAGEFTDLQYNANAMRFANPLQIGSIFISYSWSDSDFVELVESKLSEKGIRYWRDKHQATSGPVDKQLDRAIGLNDIALIVLSRDSVKSKWCRYEIERAVERELEEGREVLCPVALDDTWLSARFNQATMNEIKNKMVLDFSGWQDKDDFERVYKQLEKGLPIYYGKSRQEQI